MPDTHATSAHKNLGFLGKKIGPVPIWLIAIAIVAAYYWYSHYGPGAQKAASADQGIDPATGVPYADELAAAQQQVADLQGGQMGSSGSGTRGAQGPQGPAGPPGPEDKDRPDKDKRPDRDKLPSLNKNVPPIPRKVPGKREGAMSPVGPRVVTSHNQKPLAARGVGVDSAEVPPGTRWRAA